jgi:hypothetical protein
MTSPAPIASKPRSALRVRLATPADLDAIAAFLARMLGGAGGPARYRRFFEYRWPAERPNLGALIEDEAGALGGFLGAIYSTRVIRGQPRAICNLTSWAVDAAYRRASLAMLKCLLDQDRAGQPKLTFTTFSASPDAAEILRFLKFETARSDKLLFSAAARLRRLPGDLRVLDGADAVRPALADAERQILDDHRSYRCGHLLLERGDRRCYAVTLARGHGAQKLADVLYASDPQLFVDGIAGVVGATWRAHRTVLTGIDLRWVERPPRFALCYTGLRPVMFRSDELAARDICALHSELVPTYG